MNRKRRSSDTRDKEKKSKIEEHAILENCVSFEDFLQDVTVKNSEKDRVKESDDCVQSGDVSPVKNEINGKHENINSQKASAPAICTDPKPMPNIGLPVKRTKQTTLQFWKQTGMLDVKKDVDLSIIEEDAKCNNKQKGNKKIGKAKISKKIDAKKDDVDLDVSVIEEDTKCNNKKRGGKKIGKTKSSETLADGSTKRKDINKGELSSFLPSTSRVQGEDTDDVCQVVLEDICVAGSTPTKLDTDGDCQGQQNEASEDDTPVRRRSSRRAKPVKYTEVEDENDSNQYPTSPVASKLSSKTRSKSSAVKSPAKQKNASKELPKSPSPAKQKNTKLAPIFLKGKQKVQASPERPKENPLVVAARKAFLFSGLPEQVRKMAADHSVTVAEESTASQYPPWPLVSHIQQVDGWVWNLPATLSNLIPTVDDFDVQQSIPYFSSFIATDDFTTLQCQTLPSSRGSPSWMVKEVNSSVIMDALDELSVTHSQYSWKKTYSQCIRKQESSKASVTGSSTEKESGNAAAPSNIEASKPTEKPGRRKRRSSRTKQKSADEVKESAQTKDEDVVIVAEYISPKKSPLKAYDNNRGSEMASSSSRYLQWTDKYHPDCSGEVVGNSSSVKKLYQWLKDWKHRSDRHTNIMKQQMMKILKKHRVKYENESMGGSDDSMSEFSWSDCDDGDMSNFIVNEDEDSSDCQKLCNTVIITGPSGVGKTCAVYAIARELGYRVFEMNASNKRNGKNLVSQLKECTQSHQVTKKKDTSSCNTQQPTLDGTAARTIHQTLKESSKERRKQSKGSKKTSSKDPSKAVEAIEVYEKQLKDSSASLILFEEVDLVFDDDDGYWQAINTFMATTKRPIILTTNDSNFIDSGKLKEPFDVLKFKQPNLEQVSVYLQSLCLVEGVVPCADSINQLILDCHCDIRRCMLTLQYLLEAAITPLPHSTSNTTSSDTTRSKRRVGKFILDDDEDVERAVVEKADKETVCYRVVSDRPSQNVSSDPLTSLSQAAGVPTCQYTGAYIKYTRKPSARTQRARSGQRKRILDFSFDTEDSDTEEPATADTAEPSTDNSCDAAWAAGDYNAEVGEAVESALDKVCCCLERRCEHVDGAVDFIGDIYDTMSVLDCCGRDGHISQHVTASLSDDTRRFDDGYTDPSPDVMELLQLVPALSASLLSERMTQTTGKVTDGHLDELKIPVRKVEDGAAHIGCSHHGDESSACFAFITSLEEKRHAKSIRNCYGQLLEHTFDHLTTNRRVFYTDYVPVLEGMCQHEHLKQVANLKRRGRFLHYLDGAGLHLKPSCLEQLISAYQ